jgi:2-hydroxychromene-2-carboxylate isomerase
MLGSSFPARQQIAIIRWILAFYTFSILTVAEVLATSSNKSTTRSIASVITPIPIPPSALSGGIILLQPPYGISTSKIVRLDIYGELLCPDYRDFVTTVESIVLERYKHTNLLVLLHLFPLPYHHASYVVNQAALALSTTAKDEDPGDILRLFRNAVFTVQDMFENEATMNKTTTEIMQMVGDIAASVGLSREVAMALDGDVDRKLRSTIKAAWAKGVTGTPSLFLNSVPLYLAGTDRWTDGLLSDVIDTCIMDSSNVVDFA